MGNQPLDGTYKAIHARQMLHLLHFLMPSISLSFDVERRTLVLLRSPVKEPSHASCCWTRMLTCSTPFYDVSRVHIFSRDRILPLSHYSSWTVNAARTSRLNANLYDAKLRLNAGK
jgi:hypothetical protein